jgi:hypothetical protein
VVGRAGPTAKCELSTGAGYHVSSREDIVFDDGDGERLVETLGEAATRANWQVLRQELRRRKVGAEKLGELPKRPSLEDRLAEKLP